MRCQRPEVRAGYCALAVFALFHAGAACNYDFDLEGLAPPLDAGSGQGGAAGTGRSDAAGGAAGKSGAAGTIAADAGRADGRAGAGTAGNGSGGGGGAAGSSGSGGTGATSGSGGSGAGGLAGSAGVGGAGAAGGAGGSGASSGAAGTGASSGAAGAGGSTQDASADGSGGSGTGGGGRDAGGAGTGTAGASGTGGTGVGGSGGTGSGGGGAGGTGTGGTDGGPRPPDSGGGRDVRADSSADVGSPPFDCASVGGQVYENHCYYVRTAPVTWEVAAKQACAAPAHLVTVTSAGEDTFVTSFLMDQSRWIGLYRPAGSAKTPAAFEWVTGEARTIARWYSSNGEPDYDGDCVRLGPSNNWGDVPCSTAFPAICERE
jgi:hypothetical protein